MKQTGKYRVVVNGETTVFTDDEPIIVVSERGDSLSSPTWKWNRMYQFFVHSELGKSWVRNRLHRPRMLD